MVAKSLSDVRAHFSDSIDFVQQDREPILITRNGEDQAVLISINEYRSLEETAHLLRSPANAERLLSAIRNIESGNTIPFNLP